MKERIFFFTIIAALLVINAYTLLRFNNLKKQKVEGSISSYNLKKHENDEFKIYKSNFEESILNSNFEFTGTVVKDSMNNMIPLKSIFNDGQNQLLICRFSQRHCESCVDAIIQTLQKNLDDIGIDNIVCFGNHRNNRVFQKTLPLYGIEGMKVYNVPQINLPVEELNYPYFFVLDNSLQISNVFVPEKGLSHITIKYLESIDNRFFNIKD